jgi:hypothetical protein
MTCISPLPTRGVVRPVHDRVAAVRRGLARAKTFRDTMVVLSMADQPTLRIIEQDFFFLPAQTGTSEGALRERLAQQHLRRLEQGVAQMRNTGMVTTELVERWAAAALAEFLVGVTDFDITEGGQYAITHLGDGLYEVTTVEGYDPRRFMVSVGAWPVRLD